MTTSKRMFLVACLTAAWTAACSSESGNGECTSHQGTICEESVVYWLDSCGQREERAGACVCGCHADGVDCSTPCNCDPDCIGKCCGANGCGGECQDVCGSSGQTCNQNTCACEGGCEEKTCAEMGKECGQWDDGCGNTLACGNCEGGTCSQEGVCTCTDGEKRCQGNSYQECVDGEFTEQQACSANQACMVDLGCVDCDPSAGNVCYQGDVYACESAGTIGGLVETCWTELCVDGNCGDPGCPPETQFVYVVDDAYRLLSFNPAGGANQFNLIGNIDCPAGPSWPDWGGGDPATPFSMSVDRDAKAWVLYTSGEIFWVSTTDASCQATPFVKGQLDFKLFGMGFVSDEPGSDTEKLYIAGGDVDAQVMGDMAYIDPNDLGVNYIGPAPQSEYGPELTGTGKAEWFGYFPGVASTFVAQLNKSTGGIDHQWPLPGLGSDIRAWAFAHWGGAFYLFVTTYDGGYDSQVIRFDPQVGQPETLMTDLPYIIVGAGVSTCAPYR